MMTVYGVDAAGAAATSRECWQRLEANDPAAGQLTAWPPAQRNTWELTPQRSTTALTTPARQMSSGARRSRQGMRPSVDVDDDDDVWIRRFDCRQAASEPRVNETTLPHDRRTTATRAAFKPN